MKYTFQEIQQQYNAIQIPWCYINIKERKYLQELNRLGNSKFVQGVIADKRILQQIKETTIKHGILFQIFPETNKYKN